VKRPLLVFEDVGPASRRRLFEWLGVTFMATRYAVLSPLFWIGLGLATAFASHPAAALGGVFPAGLGYGVLLMTCNTLHTLGHILAGRIMGAPMQANLLTSTRDVNIYTSPSLHTPPHIRIVRALGGPFANLSIGIVALGAAKAAGIDLLIVFGWMNIAIGLWTLLPIPTLDGSTILRQLLRNINGRAART
jgi:Zn-dependent protease